MLKRNRWMIQTRHGLLLAVVIWLLAGPAIAQDSDAVSGFDLERIKRATVFVIQTRDLPGGPAVTCVSSGTLVSRDGLILTNAHSTVTSADCAGTQLTIALNTRDTSPPIPAYRAEILQSDAGLDLALLRITREMDGRQVDPATLALPFVELADSSTVSLDETLTIVGYPNIGNDPVLALRGTVQGFTFEPNADTPAWLKVRTDVASGENITGTMSGGGAYNRQGELIGIPTTAPLSRQDVGAICRFIEDTNGDGLINNADSCVPTGSAINALRPSNFARPLIRSGSLGLTVEKLSEPPAQFEATLSAPSIGNLFFAPFVTSASGMPTTVIERLPTGSDSLYLFFDYANMTPTTVYELRVTVDGNISPVFSLAPVRWSGGHRGLWFIGSSGQPWPDGLYEFTVLVDGVAAAPTVSISVGGPPDSVPTFRNIAFGLLEGDRMFGFGYVLATGQTVNAEFGYANIPLGTPWVALWEFDDREFLRTEAVWDEAEPNGAETIALTSEMGLPEGRYRLSLYLNNRLSALSEFIMIGTRVDAFPRIFSSARFTVAASPQEALTAPPVNSVTDRVPAVYAIFDWERIALGSIWQMRWSVDDVVFYDQAVPWRGGNSGQNFVTLLSGANGVVDGTYRLELLINRVPQVSIEMDIGIGQLPIDLLAQPDGVTFRGILLDADTNQGIAGASVMLLGEQYSVEDFVYRGDQLFATTTTDREGRFQFNRPLTYGTPYSIIINARGYLPLTADGFEMADNTPNPFEMQIYMTRD